MNPPAQIGGGLLISERAGLQAVIDAAVAEIRPGDDPRHIADGGVGPAEQGLPGTFGLRDGAERRELHPPFAAARWRMLL